MAIRESTPKTTPTNAGADTITRKRPWSPPRLEALPCLTKLTLQTGGSIPGGGSMGGGGSTVF